MKSSNYMTSFFLFFFTLIFALMPYATNAELVTATDELQVIQLLDDDQAGFTTLADVEAAAADQQDPKQAEAQRMLDRLERARSDADELIDTFLRTQYEVPINPVPGIIESVAIDLRIHNLYQRRMRSDMPDNIAALEKRAVATLEKIQRGVIKITESPDIAAGQIATNKKASDKLFNDDLLNRF